MNIAPEYGIDIIVLVRYHGYYSWYVSEKENWVLDYEKWGELFSEPDDIIDNSQRAEYPLLDSNNWEDYKTVIKSWLVEIQDLRNMILNNLPISSWNEKGELFPSLYINFDTKELYTSFAESTILEDFVPDNWHAEFKDFYYLIPQDLKYWIINGVDYFPLS